MRKHPKKILASLAVLSLLASCGQEEDKKKDTTGATGVTRQEQALPDGSNINGFYLATFKTLNSHIVGTIPGSASFTRNDDKLFIYLRLFAGSPKAWHMQGVYTGNRCPDLRDDKNGDGTIDIQEALAVVGNLLIPLDSDPSTQAGGRAFFPLGDLSGSYHYERVVNFSRFFGDLQAEDKDPNDNLVKITPGQGLTFVGKVVMIQGVSEDIQLPETVGSLERRRPFQTLPIACGIYEKVDRVPGHSQETEIPGPVAEVEEGQDRPAPEDGVGTSTGGTGGTSTGTNESDNGEGPVSDGDDGTVGGSSGTTGGSSGSSSTGGMTSGRTSGSGTGDNGDEERSGGTSGGRTSGRTSGSSSSGSSSSSGTENGSGSASGGNNTTTSSSSSSTTTSSSGD